MPEGAAPPLRAALGPLFAVLLVALNLRAVLVAISPLIDQVQLDTGLSESMVGFLTTLPVLCFGLISPLIPVLTRRIGMEGAITLAMLVLAGGAALRLLDPVIALYVGTVLIGAGIATGNVIVPALIKRDFSPQLGPVTGLYVTALSVGAAVAAVVVVPAQRLLGLSWRQALALWAIPAIVTALAWLPRWRRLRRIATPDPTVVIRGLYRDRVAWNVTLFMGMQSLIYYTIIAWLPTLLTDSGLSAASAGNMLGIFNFVGIPISLVVPLIAARQGSPRGIMATINGMTVAGLVGIVFFPAAAPIAWMLLLGVGQGGSVGLAFALIGMRSPDPHHATQLSSMAQTVGYGLAAIGPLAVGLAFQASGLWTVAFGLTLVAVLLQHTAGMSAAREAPVGAATTRSP